MTLTLTVWGAARPKLTYLSFLAAGKAERLNMTGPLAPRKVDTQKHLAAFNRDIYLLTINILITNQRTIHKSQFHLISISHRSLPCPNTKYLMDLIQVEQIYMYLGK